MKETFLVIGLGSMGKRRIRNLQILGVSNVIGVDVRKDRCKETQQKFNIDTYESIDIVPEFLIKKVKAFIISVPPDLHSFYITKAVENKTPCFVEASVIFKETKELLSKYKHTDVLIAPSCTLFFHPAIRRISKIIQANDLGKISNITYHSGQYLPDWHPYESVRDFYVSNKETGGAREIVPFELTWITMLSGHPIRGTGFYKKTIDIRGAEQIDDTYNIILDYKEFMFCLTVDVVSRFPSRRLLINGEKKQLIWDWNNNYLKIYCSELKSWKKIEYKASPAEKGYHDKITEEMYINEIKAFLGAIEQKEKFPNNLEKDLRVLNILDVLEKSSKTDRTAIFTE